MFRLIWGGYRERNSFSGYTLIEIMVVLATISLIFGLGYVNYRDYVLRQNLAGIAGDLKSDLNLARQLALSGRKPNDANCNTHTLNGYEVEVIDGDTYQIAAVCSGGDVIEKTVDLISGPSGYTITVPSPNPFLFKAVAGGTDIAGSTSIRITQVPTSDFTDIIITEGGEVR